MIITDRAICNAIQHVRRCASAITKKHATLNPKKDTLKRGELDDQANMTFPQEHGVDKYGGHIPGIVGEALGSSNVQPNQAMRQSPLLVVAESGTLKFQKSAGLRHYTNGLNL
jgi:hypothetical protein